MPPGIERESHPADELIEVGCKMAGAALCLALLTPIGILVAAIWVFVF